MPRRCRTPRGDLFRPPFFRPPTHFSHASHTHSPHIPRFLFCLELCFRPPNRHLQKTRTKASSGSPSTGSPSTGAPSTGSPSTGSPSTGAPSTECHEQGPKAGSCEAPTLASAQMENSQNAPTTSSPDDASTTSSADEASPPTSAPASRGVLSRLLGVFKWCMTLVMLATIFLVARELSEAQIGPRAVDSMRDSEVCFSHEPIFPICHTPIFPIYHKHSFLRYFISLTNPVFYNPTPNPTPTPNPMFSYTFPKSSFRPAWSTSVAAENHTPKGKPPQTPIPPSSPPCSPPAPSPSPP